MPKATAEVTAERVDQLQRMILEGTKTAECLAYAGDSWGVRRSQGYELLKRAWQQIKLDIDETGIDRQELLSWSIQTLMAAAGKVMKQNNPGAPQQLAKAMKELQDIKISLGITFTKERVS